MQLSRLFILRLTPGRDREQFLWKKWKRALNEVVLSCGHCFSGMPPFGGALSLLAVSEPSGRNFGMGNAERMRRV